MNRSRKMKHTIEADDLAEVIAHGIDTDPGKGECWDGTGVWVRQVTFEANAITITLSNGQVFTARIKAVKVKKFKSENVQPAQKK
jgi:hypothetical protein